MSEAHATNRTVHRHFVPLHSSVCSSAVVCSAFLGECGGTQSPRTPPLRVRQADSSSLSPWAIISFAHNNSTSPRSSARWSCCSVRPSLSVTLISSRRTPASWSFASFHQSARQLRMRSFAACDEHQPFGLGRPSAGALRAGWGLGRGWFAAILRELINWGFTGELKVELTEIIWWNGNLIKQHKIIKMAYILINLLFYQ